jgi:PAS domain S-box-containing protein
LLGVPDLRKTYSASRYALAILATAVALYLRHLLAPLLGFQNPYHTVWLAVVFSAWYCGLGPSTVTTLLGAAGVWYWFLPPLRSLGDHDTTQIFGMLGFLVFSAAIIALGESNRRGSAARSRLAAIVDCSDDAIISKDLNGTINSWNNGALRIFGYTPDEAIGQSIMMIIPPELRDEELKILQRLRDGERIEHFETVRVTKNGSRIDVSLTISPVRDSGGRVIGASKVGRDITARKKVEEAIKESELSARLLQLQDEERRRIARELHDGVGQLLTAMGMNAARLASEKSQLSAEAAHCAEENSELIHQASSEIRTVSYLLHPPMIDEMGLASELKWYLEGFAERSNIDAKLELPGNWERLPRDGELCLFRIAQECLTNIHRHSGSATALVRLWRTPEEVRLEVIDEGHGINKQAQARVFAGESTGVGLRGMRERLRLLGGGLQIRSNEKGTTVTATIALEGSASEPVQEPSGFDTAQSRGSN